VAGNYVACLINYIVDNARRDEMGRAPMSGESLARGNHFWQSGGGAGNRMKSFGVTPIPL